DDQLGFRVAVDERRELVADRRQPAPAMDQDRDATLGRKREDRRQPLVVQQEPLGAWVQLDPAGAAFEAARPLLDRLLREVEPYERDQPAVGALGVCERPVVGGAKSGVT